MRPTDGMLLRIFVGETDRYGTHPLYEWIVIEAKAKGLAGATVVRGLMGFGAHSRVIHTFKIERLAEDMPIIIELVDTAEKVESFLAFIGQHIRSEFLATTEQVRVRFFPGDASTASDTDTSRQET
jgi:PII-like signaling protein